MALTPADNQAFLREVDDNLRRDRVADLARRWGKLGLIVVAVALVLLAAFLWWQSRRAAQAGAQGEQFVQVLQDMEVGKASSTDPRLATLADSSRDGVRALARMTQAGIAARTNPQDAARRYSAIADDSGLPRAMRDLAMIRGTVLALDALPPQQVIARMKPLAVAGNPWFGSAAELTAISYLKIGRRDAAGPLFAAIARDPASPAQLRGRAAGMATLLGQTVAPIASPGALKE